jgi:hypothetical protein
MDRLREVGDEFQRVVLSQPGVLDVVLPPIVYLVARALFGFSYAVAAALILAVLLGALRLRRKQPLWYALGGVLGVALAAFASQFTGSEAGYFLPGIASGGLTALVCAASVLFHRPLVAITSHLARRWPLSWYWHERVRPAYSEVTLAWAAFFALRTGLQFALYRQASGLLLAVLNLLSGWPATVLLLIASYLYGTWRLHSLGGPSVEEFKRDSPPPWQSQRQGF